VSVSSPRRGSSSCHLFPVLPKRPGHRERGERLSDAIEALGGVFAHDSPGSQANLLLVDSTPIESARSVETTRRSQLADADYGYRASPQPLRLGLPPARAVHARGDATRAQPHLSEGKRVRGLPGESSGARIGYRYGLWR